MREYAKGRTIALRVYSIPTVLTAPVVLLFSVDPITAMLEGAFLWVCLLGFVAVVHGAVAFGLFTAASKRRGQGDIERADGMVTGWVYGVAANILLFEVSWLTFEIIYAVVHRRS